MEIRPPDGIIDSNAVMYTDGSMVDGPSSAIGRVGFGIVALNEEGEVTAKAFGTPPGWINTVPGAEAWALYEALRNMVPGASIRSESASVVNRFKDGKKAATSSKVKSARLWRMIFELCDHYSCPESQVDLELMPAHTAAWQVGRTRKGDGSRLTATDRTGNDLADGMAKKGAKLHRVPWKLRCEVETAERVALRAALQLSVTTHAANNVQEDTHKADGSSGFRSVRDSNGVPKWSALRKKRAVPPEPCPKLKKVAKTTKHKTLITKTTSGPKPTRRRPRRKPCAIKAAKAIANAARRVQATKEFLAREAAKLSAAATVQSVVAELPREDSPAEEHFESFFSVQACAPLEAALAQPEERLDDVLERQGQHTPSAAKSETPNDEPAAKRPRLLDYCRPVRTLNGEETKRRRLQGDIESLLSG